MDFKPKIAKKQSMFLMKASIHWHENFLSILLYSFLNYY